MVLSKQPVFGSALYSFQHSSSTRIGAHFQYVVTHPAHTASVAVPLQKQLGQYLRKRRGEMTLPAFARKLGISSSSLHRMEMGEKNVTLTTLERLKCGMTDVFEVK